MIYILLENYYTCFIFCRSGVQIQESSKSHEEKKIHYFPTTSERAILTMKPDVILPSRRRVHFYQCYKTSLPIITKHITERLE